MIKDAPEGQTQYEPTPEQIERAQRAQEVLAKILATIELLDPIQQQAIIDTAQRIMRLAQGAREFGPLAMSLASAQLGADFTTRQLHEDDKTIVGIDGRILQ